MKSIHWQGLTLVLAGCLSWGSVILPTGAQQQFNLEAVQLQQGTVISATSINETETQYFPPDTPHPITMTVAQDIYNSTGALMLPAGSRLYGQLQPAAGGAQIVINSLVLQDRSYPIQARSTLIPDEKDPREYEADAIAGDAAIGAVAGTIFGVLTGGVSAGGVLGGAASGVLVGNVTAPRVVILRPGQIFAITLEAPFQL